LAQVLAALPENNRATVRQEGLALLNEIKGNRNDAIKHRRREIRLMERLHKSVQAGVRAGDYDELMKASILDGRDERALKERRAILQALELER
jgi:hypothetical protein